MRLNSSSVKKGVVKNVANFTGKHLRCETFKDTYFEEHCERLLLKFHTTIDK